MVAQQGTLIPNLAGASDRLVHSARPRPRDLQSTRMAPRRGRRRQAPPSISAAAASKQSLSSPRK
jgi:hypothetical protein